MYSKAENLFTLCLQVSLDGHLFDHLLINEALDVIENAGGQFRLAACELGQTVDSTSHAELEVYGQFHVDRVIFGMHPTYN